MNALEYDKLLQLEQTLDWEASTVLPTVLEHPDNVRALAEIELFRAAMEAEAEPRAGFVEEVVAALPRGKPKSGFQGLIMLNGLAATAACFIVLLFQVGLEPTAPVAPAPVALVISLVFGVGWGRVSRKRILADGRGLEAPAH